MLALILLLAASLPSAEVASFAARIARAVSAGAREAAGPGEPRTPVRVLVRVEDTTGNGSGPAASPSTGQAGGPEPGGAAEQINRAVCDALRAEKFEPVPEGEAAYSVRVWLSLRGAQPLGVARVTKGSQAGGFVPAEGRERGVVFVLFPAGSAASPAGPARPAVEVRTHSLLSLDGPVLDLKVDTAGNLFLLQPDSLRVVELNAPGAPTKAEVGIQTAAERLRDPLVRMVLREPLRELELHTAASEIGPPPPVAVEGYTIRNFPASAAMTMVHPSQPTPLQVQPAAGRNYFIAVPSTTPGSALTQFYGIAPVGGSGRAAWAALDLAGRLQLYDASLRPAGDPAPGVFGGDVAAVTVSCAGTLVLAASADAAPASDRISVFRAENDRLVSYTSIEIDGAVRRLESVPGEGAASPLGSGPSEARPGMARVLAVTQSKGMSRIVAIELRCAQ